MSCGPLHTSLIFFLSCLSLLTNFFLKNFTILVIYLFIGYTGALLLPQAFLQLWRGGLLSSCGMQASHCSGFSFCKVTSSRAQGLQLLRLLALEHRLNSCGSQAQLLRSMWDLPGSGIEPVCPASGFFITKPPWKLYKFLTKSFIYNVLFHLD